MHFELTQRFAAPVDEVAHAFCDPGFYEALAELPRLGRPEVLSREAEEARVVMRVRYRFTGDRSPAARAVLDPAKLTWVEEATHDLAARNVTFTLHPDHYADRFASHGRYRFGDAPGEVTATDRFATGQVKVRAPFVGSTVERAIVSGLKEHLGEEVEVVERWLAGRT